MGQAGDEIEEVIKAEAKEGKLKCSSAFEIAKKYNISKADVGEIADKLDIRIINCQLGCF